MPPSHAREIEFTSKKFSSALPKMDMKSPARVMEEKSCGESSRSTNSRSATPPVSASAMHAANQAASGNITSLAQDQAAESPSDSAAMKLTSHLRRRSGTPASSRSCKSKVCIFNMFLLFNTLTLLQLRGVDCTHPLDLSTTWYVKRASDEPVGLSGTYRDICPHIFPGVFSLLQSEMVFC